MVNEDCIKLAEPKFKVGDWIISSVLGTALIMGVNDSNEYQLEDTDGKHKFLFKYIDKFLYVSFNC